VPTANEREIARMHLVVICPHLEVHSAKWQLDWKV